MCALRFSSTAASYGTHLECHTLALNTAHLSLPWFLRFCKSVSHVKVSNEKGWFSVTGGSVISEKLVNRVKLHRAPHGAFLHSTHKNRHRNEIQMLANWKQISVQFPHKKKRGCGNLAKRQHTKPGSVYSLILLCVVYLLTVAQACIPFPLNSLLLSTC